MFSNAYKIESFEPNEFWTLSINFQNDKNDIIPYEINNETDFQFLNQTKNNLRERLFFFCDAAKLPERTITDTSATGFYGPERNMARGLEFSTMDLTFMLDSELSERVVFESWQNLIVNNRTYNLNFYDEYTGRVLIYPLHENRNETSTGRREAYANSNKRWAKFQI